jgi:dTDP-4-dehydrorhamnose reductase
MTKVLVTGASGYAGSRIYADLKNNFEVNGTYNSGSQKDPFMEKLDISNKEDVISLIHSLNPEVIVHAAGIASSKTCAENKNQALAVNIEGTRNIIKGANDINANIIYISTEFAQDPSETLGITKLFAEKQIINSLNSKWLIIRPVQMIGQSPNINNDRFHNQILKNIIKGTSAIYDDSEKFQVAWLGHLSEIITLAIEKEIYFETLPLASEGVHTKYEIASDILQNFGIQCSPADSKSSRKRVNLNIEKLKQLGLPIYSYESVINMTLEEIKGFIRKS